MKLLAGGVSAAPAGPASEALTTSVPRAVAPIRAARFRRRPSGGIRNVAPWSTPVPPPRPGRYSSFLMENLGLRGLKCKFSDGNNQELWCQLPNTPTCTLPLAPAADV